MKSFRNVALLLAVVLFTSSVFAGSASNSPKTACEANKRVQTIQRSLQHDGFTLQQVEEQPVYYFVAPKAPYVWGSYKYTYTRSAGNYSLTTDYVELTVQVSYTTNGFAVSTITTKEYTVY